MCGIFGYAGNKNASQMVMEGLKRLDYRGYDSWGIAMNVGKDISVEKDVGKVKQGIELSKLPKSTIAIGHTRWATHGAVTELNAHPHFSTDKSFVVAQNGIVENYEKLKNELIQKGYLFSTQTDTEVIVRLIEEKQKKYPVLAEAVRQAFLQLAGRNTIIVLEKNGEIIGARNGSPLLLGINKETNEFFFSSDSLSIASLAHEMIVLDNMQMIVYKNQIARLLAISNGTQLPLKTEKIAFKNQVIDKGTYPHYMLKEIHETPTILDFSISDATQFPQFIQAIKDAQTVYTVGSGTAGGAAAQIAYYLRSIAGINAISLVGADAADYYKLFNKNDLIIAPSQSGETADVLEVLEIAKKKGMKIASYVNMPGSMMSRISDFSFMAAAGPEICVMSTKIYTSQIAWGYFIAKAVASQTKDALLKIHKLTVTMQEYLNDKATNEHIQKTAQYLSKQKDIFILGKGQNLQIAKEGMIKIIEGSYIHAHAIPAGDLKHYAITLIEKGTPVVAILSNDDTQNDVLNAIHEVGARGAYVIGISPFNNPSFDIHLPVPDTGETSALLTIIPLQLIAYYMAVELGNDVDKPRNIAKSVTVK